MNPHTKTTQTKMAACEAFGLSYWADHPATGCVWAVDDSQQPHVVRRYVKAGQVALQHVGESYKRRQWDYKRGRHIDVTVYPTHDIGERLEVA